MRLEPVHRVPMCISVNKEPWKVALFSERNLCGSLVVKPKLKGQGSVASGPALPSGKQTTAGRGLLWFEQFLSESQ